MRTRGHLKNVSLEGEHGALARGAFEDKAGKRKMRNLTSSFRSWRATLEAAVGWGGGGVPEGPAQKLGGDPTSHEQMHLAAASSR